MPAIPHLTNNLYEQIQFRSAIAEKYAIGLDAYLPPARGISAVWNTRRLQIGLFGIQTAAARGAGPWAFGQVEILPRWSISH
jgi:hypothetical protein